MRWFAALLLALYLVLVARLTLADPSSGRAFFELADSSATWASAGRLQWSETEVIANVALFVPIGFLLTLVLGRAWGSAVLCLLLSVAIELAQLHWFPTRVPSVADVRHNVFGGLVGGLVALPLLHLRRFLQPRVA